ncbi:DUF421 domain-containing protein [Terriglobus albidus]|uniref:DUF421 domain-containing protein n=1 Tax=Terriglobus albidus TaxID=1592106 RepID=UPI0021DFDBE1|nr:YetF domain-containing protein [Terriglobus albidus]
MLEHMFHLPSTVTLLEKILRPVVVYLCLIGFLRLFGKRELAQLNPFDLVVLLSLSNTVQNAIIGDDNSVSGGVIGAFSLLAINWLTSVALFRAPKLDSALQGNETILVRHGRVDKAAMEREHLTEHDLLTVLHKEGFRSFEAVEICSLQPNGAFYVEGKKPSPMEESAREMKEGLEALRQEIAVLRAQLGQSS